MSCANTRPTSEELKKLQKNIDLHYFLRCGGRCIHCCSLLVHGEIQYASFDTKIVKISQLEVEILGIQDMKGAPNFDDSVTSFILLKRCHLDSLVLCLIMYPVIFSLKGKIVQLTV